MADDKKVQEDLKKLEDEAYFELCQIIAEAMQLQDVDLLNARIASWKNKYKKLLDRPSTNSKSDFKKRIEFLLTQYYSEVTKYILNQLKLKEEKKVENQAKALRELYTIIRDTNDLDLLKKKVKKWEEKYPVSGFIAMYQKRIKLYTREKNLKESAFEQEQAFQDLVDITKIHGTLDELKNELTLWEEKYSINNKYDIDDFLKHQTEVKRYTSDEFLQSIARKEFKPDNIDKSQVDIVDDYNNKSFSNLSVQASAYATLLKISKSQNSVDEMFTWVYKNRNVKFNDKYKELILSATYLTYSPTYLTKLQKPNIDISKSSLSFDEYSNIGDIKRYAVISYFNLLLPPEKAIANDYFNKNIQTIYAKSEKARVSDIKEETTSISNIIDFGAKVSFKEPKEEVISYVSEIDLESIKSTTDKVIEPTEIPESEEILSKETIADTLETENVNDSEIIIDSSIEPELTIDLKQPEDDISNSDTTVTIVPAEKQEEITDNSEKPLNYITVVALSPLFFEAINNYNRQAVLINHIDSTATRYVETEKSAEVSLGKPVKTKIEEE